MNLVEILQPTDIVFFGVRASDKADNSIVSVKNDKKINNTKVRILRMKDEKYKDINIVAIKHPSTRFSWEKWNKYLNDWNPELMEFLLKMSRN